MTNRQPIAIRIACIEPLESRRLLSAVAESTLPLGIPFEPLMPINVTDSTDTTSTTNDNAGDSSSNPSPDPSTEPSTDGPIDTADGIYYLASSNHAPTAKSAGGHHSFPAGTFQSANRIGAFTRMSAGRKLSVASPSVKHAHAAVQPANGGITFTATKKVAFTKVVGGFNHPSVDQVYKAKISWGDGHSSIGTVTGTPATGDFNITGTHTYKKSGQFAVKVTVNSSIVGGPITTKLTQFTSVANVT